MLSGKQHFQNRPSTAIYEGFCGGSSFTRDGTMARIEDIDVYTSEDEDER